MGKGLWDPRIGAIYPPAPHKLPTGASVYLLAYLPTALPPEPPHPTALPPRCISREAKGGSRWPSVAMAHAVVTTSEQRKESTRGSITAVSASKRGLWYLEGGQRSGGGSWI